MDLSSFIYSIVISSLISLAATPLVRNYFVSRNWVEDPIKKHQKTRNATALTAVPRGGGLPVFLAVAATSLILLPFDRHLTGIIWAAFLTLIVGLWDDIKDISPVLRLITNIFAALVVVASGIGIAYLSNPFGGTIDLSGFRFSFDFMGNHSVWVIADLLAVFWIVWCMNIVGWSAGIEGQLPGFVSISAIFIGILGLRFSGDIQQWPLIILAGAVAGAYLGFLPYNFFPQTIMPGYSGKSLAGFFLAVLSILSGAKLATLIFLLGIPMLDAAFAILRRLIKHQPIYLGDGDHLHHRLLQLGWARPSIAVFYWLISLFLGIIALFLTSTQKFYAFLGIIILFISFTLKVSRRI